MITVARIDKDITTMIENIMEPGVYEIIIDTGKRSADNYLLKVSYIYRLMKGLRFEYELYNHTYRGYNGYPEFA